MWDHISIRKVGRQHLSNQNQHTEGQWKNKRRAMILINKLKFDANNRSYVTNGDKSWTKTKWMTGNQYKPNISVFIRDTDSIRKNKIHEGESYEAEHRFNWETHSSSAGVAWNVATYIWKIHNVNIENISF
jgi:hypothetical protein